MFLYNKQFNKTDDSTFDAGTVDIKERVVDSRDMSSIDEDGRGLDVCDSSEDSLVFDMEVSSEQHGMTATMDLDDLDSFVVYDQPHTIIEPDYEVGLINRTVVHEGKSNVDVIKMDSRSGKQLLQLSGLPLKR